MQWWDFRRGKGWKLARILSSKDCMSLQGLLSLVAACCREHDSVMYFQFTATFVQPISFQKWLWSNRSKTRPYAFMCLFSSFQLIPIGFCCKTCDLTSKLFTLQSSLLFLRNMLQSSSHVLWSLAMFIEFWWNCLVILVSISKYWTKKKGDVCMCVSELFNNITEFSL